MAQRIQETEDVVTFVVERTDERDVKPSLPGQYVAIKMRMPDGVHQPWRAGIGITPMAGMLSHLVNSGSQRQVILLHADVSEESFPTRAQVTEDLAKLPDGTLKTWFLNTSENGKSSGSGFSGFMDVSAVDLPDDAEYYLCGPLPFLQSVRSALVTGGVRAKDIQYEVFGPDLWLADFH